MLLLEKKQIIDKNIAISSGAGGIRGAGIVSATPTILAHLGAQSSMI